MKWCLCPRSQVQGVARAGTPTKTVLGSGSYGQVYLAAHPTTGRQVAVKEVLTGAERGIEQSTLREIAILQFAHKHPHIVELLAVEKPDDRRLCLILNCAHGTLQNYLCLRHEQQLSPFVTDPTIRQAGARQSPRYSSPEDLVQWHAAHSALSGLLYQINRALLFLHEHTILHRDIKPDNILFTVIPAPQESRGFVLQAQLCDFGLSRFLHCPATEDLSHVVVTVPYRAPELFDLGVPSTGEYDVGIDMWSFGCVLYEALSGGCRLFHVVESHEMVARLHRSFDRATGAILPFLGCQLDRLVEAYPEASAALSLLHGLLTISPVQRLTAYEVAHHPWWYPVRREIMQHWPLPPTPVKNPLANTRVISTPPTSPTTISATPRISRLPETLLPYQSCHPPLHQLTFPLLFWYLRRKAILWMFDAVFLNNQRAMTRQCALLLLDRYCAICADDSLDRQRQLLDEFPALLGAVLMIASKLHDYMPYDCREIECLLRPDWQIPTRKVFAAQLRANEWSVLTALEWQLFEINIGFFFQSHDLLVPSTSFPTPSELVLMCRDPRIMSQYTPEQLYDYLRQWMMTDNIIRRCLQNPYRPALQIRARA